jgi:hypothetical protein
MKWVTRARPKIDRIACPWLIARFIDDDPEFLFVPGEEVLRIAEQTGATPFDVPNVELGHVGDRCSFDAFLRLYELTEPALRELATIVRAADTGRLELAAEAPGLIALSRGLGILYADDQDLLRHGMILYDALYAWLKEGAEGRPADPDAAVTEASEQSFPASDPPSFTPVSGARTPDDKSSD